ncbi:MAG: DUF533 domain-containing protein [Paracoccaceae bacterium]
MAGTNMLLGSLMSHLCCRNARRSLGAENSVALINAVAIRASSDGTGQAVVNAASEEDLPQRLLQAMVAAAKADGKVTRVECAAIERQLGKLGLEMDAQALIAAELASPCDARRIAALARNSQEAAAIYTASLLVVNRGGVAETGYLAMLASRLGLDAGLVARLEASLA